MIQPYYEKTFTRHDADKAAVASGARTDIRFNRNLGLAYVKVIETMQHCKGDLAGQLIRLEQWQKRLVAIMGGWERRRADGRWVRRWRTGYIKLPRKNGKTLLGSAFAVADMIIRPDQGGEVAFFATKRDQAKLAYNAASCILRHHPELRKLTREVYGRTRYSRTDTELYTLGRDSDTLDGLNVGFGLCDEHHAHKDDSIWDVVKSSQGSRREPFILSITTAGFNIASPAYRLEEHAKKVLDGVVEDDSLFAFIAEAPPAPDDDPDFYFREEVWRAANPNYGVSIDVDEFAQAAAEARERPDKLNNFLVKRLNVWTTQQETFIPLDRWDACRGEVDASDTVIVGLDMSLRDDFTAVALVSRVDDRYHVRVRCYIPEATVYERERELRAPLSGWVEAGHLIATPGNTIDEEYILRDIREELDHAEAVCYDPHRARRIIRALEDEDGYDACIPIRQGYVTLSEPTSWLLKLVTDGKIVHDGDPVLTWMVSNMAILTDAAGNIKPDKADYNRKIDGVAAIINTLAYLIHDQDAASKPSIYEERGLIEL